MDVPTRAELEERLRVLAADFLNYIDSDFPEGFDLGPVMIVAETRTPWEGDAPGSEETAYSPDPNFAVSYRTWCSDWRDWVQAAMLREARALYSQRSDVQSPSDDEWVPAQHLPSDHRDDFEQRVLALLRSDLAMNDGYYPSGYGIGRFGIVYEVLAPRDEEDDEDQEGRGWAHSWYDHSVVDYAFSDTSYWTELALVREVLRSIENAREDARWETRNPPDEPEGDQPAE